MCNKKICFCNHVDYYIENIESIIKIQKLWKNYRKNNSDKILRLDSLIKKKLYIKTCKSNKKKDVGSISYLIKLNLSQSDCIKLGNAVEKIFYDIILYYNTKLKDIKTKNKKGQREKDHLLCDEHNKIIYYAEFKSNINLDTEKSKSTNEKILNNVMDLKKTYPSYIIKWGLVSCRYTNSKNIPTKLKYKYKTIINNLFGINIRFTFSDYCEFLNKIPVCLLA